jgi:hypothetical protein
MDRARRISDTNGLTKCSTIVRGALPTAQTYGNFVERNDTGVTSPVKPTRITRLPAGPTQTFVYSSPLRTSITYVNPQSTTVHETYNQIPTSPIRVSRQGQQITTVTSPLRVSTVLSPSRTITEHPPRYIGSSNITTSTYIPAATTTITRVEAPVTTTTTTTTDV